MNKSPENLESDTGGRSDLKNELIALREALEAISVNQSSLNRELEETCNSLTTLGERLRTSCSVEQLLKTRIDSDTQKIAEVRNKLLALEVKVAETDQPPLSHKSFAATGKTLATLEEELEVLKFNKTALEESLKARIVSDTEKIAELRDKLLAAEIAVAETTQTGRSEAHDKAFDHMKNEIETLKSEKAALCGRAEKAEQLLEEARKETAMFAGEAHDLTSQVLVSEAALAASDEKLRLIAQNEKILRKELAAMHEEVLALRARLSEGSHALDAERAKVRALAADLDNARKRSDIHGAGAGIAATSSLSMPEKISAKKIFY
jgi:chromosome segregation ATPase